MRNRVLRIVLACLLFHGAFAHAALTPEAKLRIHDVPGISYNIAVNIDPVARKYSGSETVTYKNRQKKSTNYLLFFLYPNDPGITKSKTAYMKVSNVRVNGKEAHTESNGPSLRIYLPGALNSGQSTTVDLNFTSEIPKQDPNASSDIFTQALEQLQTITNPDPNAQPDYGIYSASADVMNLGLWYPALSKFDEDGWDEEAYSGIGDVSYYDPADFNVALSVPAGYNAVTSGSTVSSTRNKTGAQQLKIESPQSREFVIEISKKFDEKDALRKGTTIRSFFLAKNKESGVKVLESAVQAFEYFSERFGPYPYTELDVVEAPLYGGAGGVEFPGLVTVSSMLYRDPSAESGDSLQQMLASSGGMADLLEFCVAHEVAHQWWNSVVGSNSKKHPYIDEAMANYSAVLYFEHFYGKEAAEKQMMMQMKLNYQVHRLAGGMDRPVSLPASAYKGPLEYAAIVYGKGALYFNSLRIEMGDEAFFDTMKRYYNEYWFRIAEPESFTLIAEERLPEKRDEIRATYKRWIEEEHGDEDIGPGTLEALMPMLLPEGADSLTDDQKELMKQLQELLKMLGDTEVPQ